jgi:hypothetical protein
MKSKEDLKKYERVLNMYKAANMAAGAWEATKAIPEVIKTLKEPVKALARKTKHVGDMAVKGNKGKGLRVKRTNELKEIFGNNKELLKEQGKELAKGLAIPGGVALGGYGISKVSNFLVKNLAKGVKGTLTQEKAMNLYKANKDLSYRLGKGGEDMIKTHFAGKVGNRAAGVAHKKDAVKNTQGAFLKSTKADKPVGTVQSAQNVINNLEVKRNILGFKSKKNYTTARQGSKALYNKIRKIKQNKLTGSNTGLGKVDQIAKSHATKPQAAKSVNTSPDFDIKKIDPKLLIGAGAFGAGAITNSLVSSNRNNNNEMYALRG